jgi:hypothetical protein
MFPQQVAFNESLDITCRYGYRLAETPVCNGLCTFSHEAYCEPVQCELGDGRREHTPDTGYNDPSNIDSINTLDPHFGMDQIVTCKAGYMADGAWDKGGGFYRGKCSSSFVRECKGDGNLTNTDVRCVVAQCPSRYEAFPPHTLGSIIENGHVNIGDEDEISYHSKVTGCGMPMPNIIPGGFPGAPAAFTSPPVTIVCDKGYIVAYSNGTKLSPETNTKELCCGGDPERGMCEWPNARDYMCVPTNACENLTEWVEYNNIDAYMELRRMGHGDDHDNHRIEVDLALPPSTHLSNSTFLSLPTYSHTYLTTPVLSVHLFSMSPLSFQVVFLIMNPQTGIRNPKSWTLHPQHSTMLFPADHL